jgi:predicted dinucleotide-binding enzyme
LIGTGNVGSALGRRFAEQGHTVVYGSRNPAPPGRGAGARTGHGAQALPPARRGSRPRRDPRRSWTATEDVVRSLGDYREDRRRSDESARDGDGRLRGLSAAADSNAERIARLAPGAQVVKAFSTLGAETMLDPRVAQGPVTIPIVGDDRAAKAVVATLAREIGLEAIDGGRSARANHRGASLSARMRSAGVNFHFPRDTARD